MAVYEDPYDYNYNALPPPLVITETALQIATEIKTVTHTEHHTVATQVTVPPPANTRRVASPTPELVSASSPTTNIPRTTAVEVVVEEPIFIEPEEDETETVTVVRNSRPRRRARWW